MSAATEASRAAKGRKRQPAAATDTRAPQSRPRPQPPSEATLLDEAADALQASLDALGVSIDARPTDDLVYEAHVTLIREHKRLVSSDEVARYLGGMSATTVRNVRHRLVAAGRMGVVQDRHTGKPGWVPLIAATPTANGGPT